jgi:hypothetical protein
MSLTNRSKYLLDLICRTSINHRFFQLKPPHEPLNLSINNELIHGSDILRICADKWGSKLFTLETLGYISSQNIAVDLGFGDLGVEDNEERAELLNELNTINPIDLEYFTSDILNIDEFNGWLRRFKAFSDPFRKKVQLIGKIGLRSGFWKDVIGDREVPIDYHIMEMLIRLGYILPNKYYLQCELMPDSDCMMLRSEALIALHKSKELVEFDPYDLDDYLWGISREYCHQNRCSECGIEDRCCKINGRVLWAGHWF